MGNRRNPWPDYLDPSNQEHVSLMEAYRVWDRLMNIGLTFMLIIPFLDLWLDFPTVPFAVTFFLGALTNLFVFWRAKNVRDQIAALDPNRGRPPEDPKGD